jgi:formate hydrogenlyase transcriptional activator
MDIPGWGASMAEKRVYDRVVEQLLEQLNMGHSLEDLLDSIYENLRGAMPYNRIAVALLDKAGTVLTAITCRTDGEVFLPPGYAAKIQGSTLEALLHTGQPRIINDLDQYLSAKPKSASTRLIVQEGMKSSLTLPLLAEGRPIGVVFFSSRQRDSYVEAHAALLKSLAGPIAISVEKAELIAELKQRNEALAKANLEKDQFLDRLRDEVDRRTEQLRARTEQLVQSEQRYRTLVKLGRIVSSSLDLPEVFRSTSEEIQRLVACDRVSLLLLEARNTCRHGFAVEFGEQMRWVDIPASTLAGSAAQWALDKGEPRLAANLHEQRLFPEDERLYEQGYQSYVYLPLTCRQVSVGVLGIASRKPRDADAWDLELLGELCDQLAIALDNAAAYGEIASLKSQLEEQNVYLRDEIKTSHDFGNIVGDSPPMQSVRAAISQVATTGSTVLILGETGTGKELVAREIHDSSTRHDKLLVKVNCAALAPGVITSELFGHEAGAFTGATERRQGRFEVAQGGSIFLDEIAEIPAETQVMLLRVLQERVIERVGGNVPIPVDVRVIAATNRDLKSHVDEAHFRSDLFYRLNVFPIRVPPLRERREDIPALINHFIGRFARGMNKDINRVNRGTMEQLMSYQWPGNVRELENIIERAMIVSRGDTLAIDPKWLSEEEEIAGTGAGSRSRASFAEMERQTILDALQRCGGKVYGHDGAAALLKLKPTTLYGKMRKLNITRRREHFEHS